VPQCSQNMRLENLICFVVLQDVIRSIVRLVVIWNMLLSTGEWIQKWLVGGVTTGMRKASQLGHLLGLLLGNFYYSIFGEVHGVGQGGCSRCTS
jgi:hypothetical protein